MAPVLPNEDGGGNMMGTALALTAPKLGLDVGAMFPVQPAFTADADGCSYTWIAQFTSVEQVPLAIAIQVFPELSTSIDTGFTIFVTVFSV